MLRPSKVVQHAVSARVRAKSVVATKRTQVVCPFCFQPGVHRTASNCLSALDWAVARDKRRARDAG